MSALNVGVEGVEMMGERTSGWAHVVTAFVLVDGFVE